ncbi:MAG: hypothetical protein M1839_004776 [Geoglossum umbratile]|nr:MAG: hypothetical protein M1839_004776 [Geoglossum umbratile]
MSGDTPVNPYPCPTCPLSFGDRSTRKNHKKTHPRCEVCGGRFGVRSSFESHQQATGHCYCCECNLHFKSIIKHVRHVREVQHRTEYQCCDCGRKYPDQTDLDHHCCDCDISFYAGQALEKHLRKHARHRPCASAPRAPVAQAAKPAAPTPSPRTGKPKSKKSRKKRKCRNIPCPASGKCHKKFAQLSAVLDHLESGRCPSGMTRTELNKLVIAHDKDRYITHGVASPAPILESPSADILSLPEALATALQHDAGAVLPPTENDSLSEWSDINGVPLLTPSTSELEAESEWFGLGGVPLLTPRTSELEAESEWSDLNGGQLLTPSASEAGVESEWSLISGIHTPVSNAPDASLHTTILRSNLSLQCPICPTVPNQRTFSSIKALQAHISSIAHAPKIFHCPFTFPAVGGDLNGGNAGTRGRKKKLKEKYFKSLSGLARHMEYGSCKGGIELFREATRYVEEEIKKMGFAEVRLLE